MALILFFRGGSSAAAPAGSAVAYTAVGKIGYYRGVTAPLAGGTLLKPAKG